MLALHTHTVLQGSNGGVRDPLVAPTKAACPGYYPSLLADLTGLSARGALSPVTHCCFINRVARKARPVLSNTTDPWESLDPVAVDLRHNSNRAATGA